MSVNDDDILEIPSPDEAPEVELVPLFKMGGDVYEVPKKLQAGLALEYLEMQADKGPDTAAIWITKEVLGEEVYTMLKDHPTLDFDQFNDIFERLEKHVLGPGKDKAKTVARGARRRGGSKKSRGS